MLFIDATGVLSGFGSPPTGIPRVERFLVDAALADPDAGVKVVRYDRRRRAFRELSALEDRQLRSDADAMFAQLREERLLPAVGRIFQFIRENPAISRNADRYFGDLLTGNRRGGLAYAALKTLFRAYRLWQLSVVTLRSLWRGGHPRTVTPAAGTVLLSNPVVLASFLPAALRAAGRAAFICHDAIPIVHPDFAVDAAHARRFAGNIALLLRAQATVICSSAAGAAMLAKAVPETKIRGSRLGRVPLPSILFEKAARTHNISRITAPEPFILYASTVEARKNHLLLARVWQQAAEEGVALPKLVCTGKWGWGVGNLLDYLKAHPGLSSRIDFTGPVSDETIIAYYRGALFGVVPSRVEGWGYCASECLDFGIPVIVSTDPALRESSGGLMPAVDANDQAGWYAEIRRMSEDTAYRESLCRKIAETHRPAPAAASWTAIKAAMRGVPVPAT